MKITEIRKDILSKLNLVGNYKITEDLIDKFGEVYSGKPASTHITKPSNKRYNRKLNALSLVKYKRVLGIPSKDIPEGFIYIMIDLENPGYCKVGRSLDPRDRLMSAQTYSPNASFKLSGWYFTSDMRKVEAEVHYKLHKYRCNGEWFKISIPTVIQLVLRVIS